MNDINPDTNPAPVDLAGLRDAFTAVVAMFTELAPVVHQALCELQAAFEVFEPTVGKRINVTQLDDDVQPPATVAMDPAYAVTVENGRFIDVGKIV